MILSGLPDSSLHLGSDLHSCTGDMYWWTRVERFLLCRKFKGIWWGWSTWRSEQVQKDVLEWHHLQSYKIRAALYDVRNSREKWDYFDYWGKCWHRVGWLTSHGRKHSDHDLTVAVYFIRHPGETKLSTSAGTICHVLNASLPLCSFCVTSQS